MNPWHKRANEFIRDPAELLPLIAPQPIHHFFKGDCSRVFDRLVVVKGPQTVLWGPGASAGTVRFERDTPRFDAPGLRVDGSLLGGSHGRNDQVLDATAGASRGYARLSANRSEADDYEDGDGRRVPSAWKKWNADLALGWTPDADTLLEFNAGIGDGVAAGGDTHGAGGLGEADFGQLRAVQPAGRSGERVHPHIGLAGALGVSDQRRLIERR